MSESDLSNLIYLAMGMSTSLFEFWLSASFAVAVVAYFLAGKLNGPLLKLVSTIYLLASVALLLGWFAFSSQVSDYLAMMVEQGYETGHFNSVLGILHGLGILSVFVIGTIGVLYYLHWTHRRHSSDT